MLKRFYPKLYVASAYEIPFEAYIRRGVRGVIFDIDNTLVPHDAQADRRAVALFNRIRAAGADTCLLSNNKEPRVSSFAGQVGSRYIYKSGKPGVRNYRKAMQMMGTDEKNTLFIGDQLFTDVYGANRAGVYSILVSPMDPHEEIQIVLKRVPEKLVLYFYRRYLKKRNHIKG